MEEIVSLNSLNRISYPRMTNTHNDDSDTEQVDSLPHDVEKNIDTDILGVISNRRKNSSTSYNLKNIISAFKSDKNKKEDADKSKFEDEDRDKDDFNQHFVRKQSSGNEESLTAVDDLRRQESVSSNRSDNIPVITISKTESSESILNASEGKLNENPIDTQLKDSITSSACTTDKFRPIIRYALKKQTTEVDEDSIRHFPKEVMKQVTNLAPR
ncbi:hypothetical protein WA026_016482 [Henosepilachna vigintioctopunctata]|uniref:Uncharacterized protein n=1 Tax=Henosepilachna vigintioctopunctata TaxID=420089 RepID=A0AAW1UP40_9CUCU